MGLHIVGNPMTRMFVENISSRGLSTAARHLRLNEAVLGLTSGQAYAGTGEGRVEGFQRESVAADMFVNEA